MMSCEVAPMACKPFDQLIHIRPLLQLDRLCRRIVHRKSGFCNCLWSLRRRMAAAGKRRLRFAHRWSRLPWMTETGESLTSPPITMVPVRSLTTTLAGERKLMERFCTREMRMGTDGAPLSATLTSMRLLSSAVAMVLPNSWLMTSATSRAAVKSELSNSSETGLKAAEVDGCFPFDNSAVGNSADRRMIDGSYIAGGTLRVAAYDQRPLRLSIDLPIRCTEGGEQQHPANDAFGIAHRGHGDIELHSRPGERRQVRGDKDGGYIFYDHNAGRDLYSHARESIGQCLHGKEGLLRVASASQTNDQTVSDQLIFAHALNLGYVAKQYLVHGFGRQRGKRG